MTYKCCCLDDIIRIWCRMLMNSTCNDQQMRSMYGCRCHHRFLCIIPLCTSARSARSTHCKLAGKVLKGYLSCMQNPGAFSKLFIHRYQNGRLCALPLP